MLTRERLDEIRARLQAASPGPWRAHEEENRVPVCPTVDPDLSLLGIDVDGTAVVYSQADADLIIHAPADLADLLAEVDQLLAFLAAQGGK